MATVNLRAFPEPKEINCPECHQPITLFDPDGSQFVVCNNCQAYSRFIATGYLQKQQHVSPIKYIPVIAVGTSGTLKGIPYKVIAYMEKHENGTDYVWCEYMLYSYSKGYAFLAEYDGHWSFIAGKDHFPEVTKAVEDGHIAYLNEESYLLYNDYIPIISALMGEFDWDAYEERVHSREFIRPPNMLVREQNKNDRKVVDWYFAENIERDEIAAAFNIQDYDEFPEIVDIGAHQPNPYEKRWKQVLHLSVGALVVVIALQLALAFVRHEKVVLNKSLTLGMPPVVTDTTKKDSVALATYNQSLNGNFEYKSLRTESFIVPTGPAPLDIDITAPMDNNWFEATIELVSEGDNQSWEATKEVEYYHGYEDGESWSEGSQNGSLTINNVPPGKYHLNIYPYAGTLGVPNLDITVTANVVLWQNLLITILLLAILPIIFWYLNRNFEVKRWMNSDYSPYRKEGNND